ncbi:RnfABCDGE type electron transport complex subunit D, partial [Candidatus Calescamantes bacterium]|nr:RnfABCDGE type electron transport complex subunit D [Candidatus Calescamantes bacterium]
MKKFYMSTSPHVFSRDSVKKVMWNVNFALLPAAVWAILRFGMDAFISMLVAITAAVLAEWLFAKLFKQKIRLWDGSAFLTGLLMSMTLPPGMPIIFLIVGAFFAIGFGKAVFGGLGYNPFNPALIGRAFLAASWPVAVITWKEPTVGALSSISAEAAGTLTSTIPAEAVDTITSATPLGALGQAFSLNTQGVIDGAQLDAVTGALSSKESILDLFLGNIGGSLGEISALLLLIGGLYLLWKKIITWHIPVVYILTIGLLSWVFGGKGLMDGSFLFSIFAGGVFLGAFFMATDLVTSPMYSNGKMIYAFLAGVLVVMIRRYG